MDHDLVVDKIDLAEGKEEVNVAVRAAIKLLQG